MKPYLIFLTLLIDFGLHAQVTLEADGPGQTYELITSVLAPGHNPIESPGEADGSCDNHTSFGRHISEVFDTDLNKNVFKFSLHVANDNDRCRNFDRQRNEIKSYDQSPDNLLGVEGETVEYRWKFKMDINFQPSSSFTHLHQLKAVGGTEDSMPLITLTARKATPDRLELRYAETTSQVTLTTIDLSLLKDKWIEVIETVTYGEIGIYNLIITDIDSDTQILNYSDPSIRMWKTQADFIRPKWGIYRSLNNASQLRDEEVLFADFSILEDSTLSVDENALELDICFFPNPSKGIIQINSKQELSSFRFSIKDISGKLIKKDLISTHNTIDISGVRNGLYFIHCMDTTNHTSLIKKMLKI